MRVSAVAAGPLSYGDAIRLMREAHYGREDWSAIRSRCVQALEKSMSVNAEQAQRFFDALRGGAEKKGADSWLFLLPTYDRQPASD
jgi:hypothetical protein